jgi:hypothetical protein
MHLLQMRLAGLGPFNEIELGFSNDAGEPRLATAIHGGGGVGKSTLLSAIASTRPGNASVITAPGPERDTPGSVICEYRLGQDDPERPHSLAVASPSARVFIEEDLEVLRRREQSFFDRASRDGGFVFVSIPATRWYSRQPVAIVAPARGVARYDVRAPIGAEDPMRLDLARETKQVLAYARITSALAGDFEQRFARLAKAMAHAVNSLVGLAGYRFVGVEPLSLEPLFTDEQGREVLFDLLPTRVRGLATFAALPARALWAAYPQCDPLDAEGIVTIDEVDTHQDELVLARLIPALRNALPRVQWIVTTSSPVLASSCDVSDVIALRRSSERNAVEQYTGAMALTH